jgi:transposase InsO family protein
MTSGTTREFMAMCAIAQHFGRPGTPTDQAWIESLFGHVKAEWPKNARSLPAPRAPSPRPTARPPPLVPKLSGAQHRPGRIELTSDPGISTDAQGA